MEPGAHEPPASAGAIAEDVGPAYEIPPERPSAPMQVVPRMVEAAGSVRATHAEIDLARIRHNLREVYTCLEADCAPGERRAAVWPVVKADGYGHGAPQVAQAVREAGAEGIAVALLEEALLLRQAEVRGPTLVMGGYYGTTDDGFEALVEHGLSPVVYEIDQLPRLAAAARRVLGDHGVAPVHLQVDTGMGRLGVRPEGIDAWLKAMAGQPRLTMEGLMTHLACADGEELGVSDEQLRIFDEAREKVRRAGHMPRYVHAANSAASIRLPGARFDVIRAGLAIYGVHPCPQLPSRGARAPALKPAMRLRTEVVALRDLEVGDAIGYGHTWRARRPSRIATLSIGYADGLDRGLSNRGEVLVAGQRAPIVGNVSMDLTMIDVTGVEPVAIGDEVVIFGEQTGPRGTAFIGVEEVADTLGTIPWVPLTSWSRRVPRTYTP